MGHPSKRARRSSLLIFAVLALGCGDRAPTAPDPHYVAPDAALAKGGKPGGPGGGGETADPVVASVDPSSGTQDTTLDVEVSGDNFVDGSTVEFELAGEPATGVITNHTTFVSPKRLVANITIAADAAEDLYDVAVKTPPGRKGVGLELFEIVRKGSPNAPLMSVRLNSPQADPDLRVFDDGGGDYVGAAEGTVVEVARQFRFVPNEGSSKGRFSGGRTLCLRFLAAEETTGAGIPTVLEPDLDADGVVCATGDLRTLWHSNDDLGLEAMVPGETMQAGARFVWADPKGQDEFRLEFFCFGMLQTPGGAEACVDLTDVTLVQDDETGKTWQMRFDATLNAGLSTRKVKSTTNTWTPIAAFSMPFELTVRVAAVS